MIEPDPLVLTFCLGAFVLIIVLGIYVGWRSSRRFRALEALRRQLQAGPAAPLYITGGFSSVSYDLRMLGGSSRRGRAMLAVTTAGITLYEYDVKHASIVQVSPASLRWFGRPRKYSAGLNEIWLHIEQDDGWHTLRLRLYADAMRQFVRALKQIADPELVTAYRRRRPYVHFGPLTAQPAEQDIHGAWTLAEPLSLYLTPRHLAVIAGSHLLRALPLDHVQGITVVPRIDRPSDDKLVRFIVDGEPFAFAAPQAEAFAGALAEAARRTLEAPLTQKQKDREDDDWDYDDEDVILEGQDF